MKNGFSQNVTYWTSNYPRTWGGVKQCWADFKDCKQLRLSFPESKRFRITCIEMKEYTQPYMQGISSDRRAKGSY